MSRIYLIFELVLSIALRVINFLNQKKNEQKRS